MSTTAPKTKVTALPGDGIGPEVMAATMRVLEAANAPIEWEMAEAGAEVFRKGLITGVPRETLESITRTGLALKSPRLWRKIRQCHLAQIFRALRQYPAGS
jgi:isocitrate dehydrogenase